MIPYGRQDISEDDIAAVVDVLRSDFLTTGPLVGEFEKAVASYCGATGGVAVNSATSALHIACMALGLGPGDILWTVPNTFVASANCALYCGASVDFVDIDANTLNMDVAALANKLAKAEQEGKLPKIVIPVHFSGLSCEMAEIGRLAKQYGFRVIEDASHAIGGTYEGSPVGNCAYSDFTIFSFHPVKIITTAEGGMLLSQNKALLTHATRLRQHGVTREPTELQGEPDGPWSYQQIELGLNYRLSDIHAALGLSQMQRLDDFIARRAELADRYDTLLTDLPLRRAPRSDTANSAWHLYVIQLADSLTGSRRAVFEGLRAAGIGVNVHYIPVHTQPYYHALGFRAGDFPVAEAYYARAITLPMFANITFDQQDSVVKELTRLIA